MATIEIKPEIPTATRAINLTKPELALGGRGTDTSGGTPPTGNTTVSSALSV